MFEYDDCDQSQASDHAVPEKGIAGVDYRRPCSNLAHSPHSPTRTTQHSACASASTGVCRHAIWIRSGQLHAIVTATLAVLITNHAASRPHRVLRHPVAPHCPDPLWDLCKSFENHRHDQSISCASATGAAAQRYA
jgi:hypothetical protein